MTPAEIEAQYDNRANVPEWADHMARWQAASAAARAALAGEADIPYGPKPRNRFDLFLAPARRHRVPRIVYIHGGYWQRGDRKDYSLVAAPFVAAGLDVAIPSYSHCPDVGVADIVDEMRALMVADWKRSGQRAVVVGHSAGGHLAASLLATDWSSVPGAAGVPADLVRVAYAVSGVYDLTPLPVTTHNQALRLDAAAARAASPLFGPIPPAGRHLVAAVGANETREFIRQSLAIAGHWEGEGPRAECVVLPGHNHFTVVDALSRPDGAVARRIVELARADADRA